MSRETADPTEIRDKTSPELEEDLEDLALGEDYALNPDFVAMVVDAADRGDAERLRDLLGALHPADVADLMGFLSADHREEIPDVAEVEAGLPDIAALPTLIIWGDADFAFGDNELRRWKQTFADPRTVVVEGAGHYVPSDAPEQFAAAIRDWHMSSGS